MSEVNLSLSISPMVFLSSSQAYPLDPRRHWPFASHGRFFVIHSPLVISETDETRAWIVLRNKIPRIRKDDTIDVVILTGGPLVLKDEATGNWARKIEIRMTQGDNHTLILRKDPDWQISNNATLNFIYHGTLVVEMVSIGDSRGVDVEIERSLISVIRSSVRTFSGLVSTATLSAIVSTLTLLIGIESDTEILTRLPDSVLIFIATYVATWIFVNFVKRPWELYRRLASNIDYLNLIRLHRPDIAMATTTEETQV